MGKKALIVGAAPDAFWDGRWTPDLVICADGGAERALGMGFTADVWIGDGDSGGTAHSERTRVFSLPVEKDLTDLHACVNFALTEGFAEIALVGVTGGRLDHFLSAVGMLELIGRRGGFGFILDAENELTFLETAATLHPPHRYAFFSVIPLDEEIVVSISGARFPLHRKRMRREESLGVSNRPLEGEQTVVTLGRGRALLVQSGKNRALA